MKNYCIDCNTIISQKARRCKKCAAKKRFEIYNKRNLIPNLEKEKSFIINDFEINGYGISALSKKYKHSKTTIRNLLISELDKSAYQVIILKNRREKLKQILSSRSLKIKDEEGKNIVEDFKKSDGSLEKLSKNYHHSHDRISEFLIDNMGIEKYKYYISLHNSHKKGLTGTTNPNWRGGISSKEKIFYASKKWKDIKKKIIERDFGKCQLCGKKGIEVHHIIPKRLSDDDSLSNLVLLCKSCHQSIEILTSNFIERHGIGFLTKLQIEDGNVFRKTLQRVGFDIYMINNEIVHPHKFKKLKTNLRFPQGLDDLFAILTLRSSYQDSGLLLPGGIGIIDGDYTDKIFITVYNITDEMIEIKKKERIAQLVFLNNVSRHIILENKNNDTELVRSD